MAIKNKSEISTINDPEFINLTPSDISPMVSKCDIKVFYLGHNRNGSYINKETATNMSKTLRGTPIVAVYRQDKEDFGDHGNVITIEDGEIHFSCKTIPYGFVSPESEIWFQNFIDTDEFDNRVERTYLMTQGYLWTSQYQEIMKVIEEGQPQSMELDGQSLKGHWAEDSSKGVEFFIIDDATFSKLCILGDDVEPCYEGSSVTKAEFTKEDFENTLFTMMKELKDGLENKGGLDMKDQNFELENNEAVPAVETIEVEAPEVEVPEAETPEVETEEDAEFKKDPKEEDTDSKEDDKDDSEDEDKEDSSNDEDDKKKKEDKKFSNEQFEAMNAELESLRAEVKELREFKLHVENEKKQSLIDKYFMLSDEDKKDIVDHMTEYSLDQIQAKLAIKYVEQNVDFSQVDGKVEEVSPNLTFSLEEETTTEQLTDLQRALHEVRK